jgi:hypothetical protein
MDAMRTRRGFGRMLTGLIAMAAAGPARAQEAPAESIARKERSEAILAAEGVPFIENLPYLERVAEARIRGLEETAYRTLCLIVAAAKGETGDQAMIDSMAREWGLAGRFTPKEQVFIEDPSPTEHDRIQFSWRYEAAWALAWALSFIPDLGRPDHIADVPALVGLAVDRGTERFLADARLRSTSEILDAADLIYRYDWAVVDARVNGRATPGGLDPGVVLERHHALNWLICYLDQAWDDVSTDT